MDQTTRVLDDLHAAIASIERRCASMSAGAVLPFGSPELDAALPGRGLALGTLHEAAGSGPDVEHGAAAPLFVAGVLAWRPGTVLWAVGHHDLFAPALAGVGLHPARVLYAEASRPASVLLVMEEGLRMPGLAGVVGEASLLADLLGRLKRSGLCAHAALPNAALRLEADAIEDLRRLGLGRVGQLAAIPRAPLAHRFGAGVLLRLDQALGRLVVLLAKKLAWTQAAALAGDAFQPVDLSALVDRLANKLGAGRIFRIAPVQSDVPERTVCPVPALTSPEGPETAWPVTLPRPVRLFRPPQPVQALAALPDQPPAAFTWRRVRRRVRRSDGPERVHGGWWLRDGEARTVRDYWAVEDEAGHRYWLFRRGNGSGRTTGDLSWFLHGLF